MDNSVGSITSTTSYSESWGHDSFVSAATTGTGNENVGPLKRQYSRRSSLSSYHRNTKEVDRRSALMNQKSTKSSQSCRELLSSSRCDFRSALAATKNRKNSSKTLAAALDEEDATAVSSSPTLLDCSTVLKLQESWNKIKQQNDYQATLAECLIRNMMVGHSDTRASLGLQSFRSDRFEVLSQVLTEPIDTIVNLAGPSLPDEDLQYLRLIWVSEGVNAQRVGEVLVDSIRDVVGEDAFTRDLEKVWNVTVINVLRDW